MYMCTSERIEGRHDVVDMVSLNLFTAGHQCQEGTTRMRAVDPTPPVPAELPGREAARSGPWRGALPAAASRRSAGELPPCLQGQVAAPQYAPVCLVSSPIPQGG